MKRKLPKLKSDQAAEDFIDTADLTEFDLSGFTPTKFEFAPKDARLNMRLPNDLFTAVKDAAADAGLPYQRYIRHVLEQAVHTDLR